MWTQEMFGVEKPIIALLHLDALPGDPGYCGSMDTVLEHARQDLVALQNGGVGDDYVFPALQDSANRGDEYTGAHDHGSLATNRRWIDQGFYKNRVTECNTWLAAPSDVD